MDFAEEEFKPHHFNVNLQTLRICVRIYDGSPWNESAHNCIWNTLYEPEEFRHTQKLSKQFKLLFSFYAKTFLKTIT